VPLAFERGWLDSWRDEPDEDREAALDARPLRAVVTVAIHARWSLECANLTALGAVEKHPVHDVGLP
jgi:hypothetical protein